jgi:DNA-binding MarR family transcriptional regulator
MEDERMNKPILFNTEMVQAIMDGRKTVTRRIVKPQPKEGVRSGKSACGIGLFDPSGMPVCMSPYQIGDILWVRETWKILDVMESASMRFEYLAGGKISDAISVSAGRIEKILKFLNKKGWLPSLFMPREAARIFLRVTDVRAERLQKVDIKGARSEGVTCDCLENEENRCNLGNIGHFKHLWNSTIKPADLDRYGWNANPYVWVISFERCDKPEGFDS